MAEPAQRLIAVNPCRAKRLGRWLCAALSAVAAGCSPNRSESSPALLAQSAEVAEADGSVACDDYLQPLPQGSLPEQIDEASGLAVTEDPLVLWLHNDSGDGAHVYAIRPDGRLLAILTLSGVFALDWEDMARGPCNADDTGRGCLYVGDTGDNRQFRPWVTMYRFAIPDPSAGDAQIDAESMSVVFPGGPRDVEALVVDEAGQVFLLTKERERHFDLFSAAFDDAAGATTLVHHGSFDLSQLPGEREERVTAADYDPERRRLLVRTYNYALEYELPPGHGLADLAVAPSRLVPAAEENQGESIAYGRGGYWHVSEGEGSPIYFVGCSD